LVVEPAAAEVEMMQLQLPEAEVVVAVE